MRLKMRNATYRSYQRHLSDIPDITTRMTRDEVDLALGIAVSKHDAGVGEKKRKVVLSFWK